MLEWASPAWFAALALLPWLLRRRLRARACLPFSAFALVSGGRSWRTVLAPLPALLEAVALAAIVVALARPQRVEREREILHEGLDIMLVLDTSGSMEARDMAVGGQAASRLRAALDDAARFIAGRPDDRLGLVVFGEEAFTQVPLTLDHDAMLGFLAQVRTGMAGRDRTAIGQALAVAARRLARLERTDVAGNATPSGRVIVLLTDGRNNAGSVDPLVAADAAAALGIRVYTIGVGGEGRGLPGLLSMLRGPRAEQVDMATLEAIAERTGGRAFRARDGDDLREVFQAIDELEPTTAEVRERVDREERFQVALVPGLGLYLLQWLLARTLLRRLP